MRIIHKPTIKALLVSFFIFWTPVVLFFAIADEVIEREPLFGDVGILQTVHRIFSSDYYGFFLFWTTCGSALVISTVTAAIVGLQLFLKKPRSAALVAFGVGGAALANLVLKSLFQRARPSLWESAVHEHSFSFPSGHAMASSALVFCIIALTWKTRWRWPTLIAGLSAMLLVGFSRLYFGVHYPSDVAAGWLASLVWVLLVTKVVRNPHYFEKISQMRSRLPFVSKG